ncbi:MAG: hypothetical protein GKR87_08390 [Kiritimatiellae bacterium]|nr:hypothetical protein [Kiritimatiellia bacterium]
MNNKSGSMVIGLFIVLPIIFFLLLSLSFRGWGYAGYRGYHRGPSLWYWGSGPRYYPSGPSVRKGSTSGPTHQGGGIHGGK